MMKFRHDAEILFVSAAFEYLTDTFLQTIRQCLYLILSICHKTKTKKKDSRDILPAVQSFVLYDIKALLFFSFLTQSSIIIPHLHIKSYVGFLLSRIIAQ